MSLSDARPAPRVLNAYLLGRLDFDEVIHLQRRLVYDVSGDRSSAVLLLCEHAHGISIGRAGSAGHIQIEPDELRARGWPVRWVNRGGGCLLHAPGQLAVYPIMALDRVGVSLGQYLERLHDVIRRVLGEVEIRAETRPGSGGVWAEGRRIASVGVAVRDWVSYFGLSLNVDPDLRPFRFVQCGGDRRPMTSVAAVRRTKVRPATLRQRLLAEFADRFGFDRVSLFHHHPALSPKAAAHAVASRPG